MGITWGIATRLCVAGYDAAIPHVRGGNYGKLCNFLIKRYHLVNIWLSVAHC